MNERKFKPGNRVVVDAADCRFNGMPATIKYISRDWEDAVPVWIEFDDKEACAGEYPMAFNELKHLEEN